ncbi:MAG: DUF1360 domain-containing protein [Oscillospiraceae bacterium]|nr:DUF1360 domain-containing protein [Oscillospiraceae bacterium]
MPDDTEGTPDRECCTSQKHLRGSTAVGAVVSCPFCTRCWKCAGADIAGNARKSFVYSVLTGR